jgi:hypothetical protein
MIFIPALQWNIVVIIYVKVKENLASIISQESSTVIEDEKKKALKDEYKSIIHTLGVEEELSPSIPIKRPRWLLQTLKDTSEALRSAVRERRPSKKFPKYMALMHSIIDVEPSNFEEETYQQV